MKRGALKVRFYCTLSAVHSNPLFHPSTSLGPHYSTESFEDPQSDMAGIVLIPSDVLVRIFFHLSVADIASVHQVSIEWRNAVEENAP